MPYWLGITSGDTFETSQLVFAFGCQDAAEVESTAHWLAQKLRDVVTIEQLDVKITQEMKRMDDLDQRLG